MAEKRTSIANLAEMFTNFYFKQKDSYDAPASSSSGVHNAGQPLVPREQGIDVSPFQYQFQTGVNLITAPRGEQTELTPFQTLRKLADNCDLVRLAIEMRKEQLSGMEWDIVSAEKDDKNDYSTDIAKVKAFFNKPDGVNNFYDWLGMILEEVLVTDSLSLYKRKNRGGGFFGLEVIDGTTIKPLRDAWGRTPLPPLAAYQQIIYGYPQSEYTIEELLYKPKNRRVWTPYGFSPVEYIIMTINIALRKQQFTLGFYTEGNLPDGGMFGVPEQWTPAQIKQFQEWWDAMMAGNFKNRQRMRFVPGKGGYIPTKSFEFQQEFEEWMARVVCTAFQINSQPFLKFTNRATAQVQDDQQTDLGLNPLCIYLGSILTEVVQAKDGLNMPHLKFKWMTEKKADEQVIIDRNVKYVQAGILGIDEVRIELGRDPLISGGVPPYLLVGGQPMFLTPEIIQKMLAEENFQTPTEKQETAMQIAQSGVMESKGGKDSTFKPKMGAVGNDAIDEEEDTPTKAKAGNRTKKAPTDAEKAVIAELKRWEKFAVNRLGKVGRDFETELIPELLVKRIKQDLADARTADEVRMVFKSGTNKMLRENWLKVQEDAAELKKD
jgi:hypothetical protein